eukprot:gene2063-18244_t
MLSRTVSHNAVQFTASQLAHARRSNWHEVKLAEVSSRCRGCIVINRVVAMPPAKRSARHARANVEFLFDTLNQLPHNAIRDSIWSQLDDDERRSLRACCKNLKHMCDSTVIRTLVRVSNSADIPDTGSQALSFPFLQRLEFTCQDGNGTLQATEMMCKHLRPLSGLHLLDEVAVDGFIEPGLVNIARLLPTRLTSLEIASSTLPGERDDKDSMPTPFFLALSRQCQNLSVLSLANVPIQTDASYISTLLSLSSLSLSGCTFHDPALELQWLAPLINLETIEFSNMDDMSHGNHWRQFKNPNHMS